MQLRAAVPVFVTLARAAGPCFCSLATSRKTLTLSRAWMKRDHTGYRIVKICSMKWCRPVLVDFVFDEVPLHSLRVEADDALRLRMHLV